MYRDDDLTEKLSFDQRVSIQAAAYTMYLQLTPDNKKPITARQFHELFVDNWNIIATFENA